MRNALWVLVAALCILAVVYVVGETAQAQQASYTIERTEEPGRLGAGLAISSDLDIGGFKVTLEYDPEKLAFQSVALAPGLLSSWQIDRINPGPFAGSLQPPSGMAWVIVTASSIDFNRGVSGGFDALRFSFTPTACGTFQLGLPALTDGVAMTQAATSSTLWPFTPLPPYSNLLLYPASVHSDCLVPVLGETWTAMKRLYR